MKNIMTSVEIEMNLKQIDNEIKDLMNKIDVQLTFIDIKYKNRLRDKELLDETTIMMNKLLVVANRLKDLEFQSIKNDDLEVYWKCEQRLAHVVETMEYIRNKYMF